MLLGPPDARGLRPTGAEVLVGVGHRHGAHVLVAEQQGHGEGPQGVVAPSMQPEATNGVHVAEEVLVPRSLLEYSVLTKDSKDM